MCVVRDECVLLVLLVVQLVGGLPIVALMKLCGVAYAVLYVFGAVLSVSLTFAPRLRWCCSGFVGLINEFGICVFLLTHSGLLALASYTLYAFLLPFFHSSAINSHHDTSGTSPSFDELCVRKKLSDNLSHTGCNKLQGALSCMCTQMSACAFGSVCACARATSKCASDECVSHTTPLLVHSLTHSLTRILTTQCHRTDAFRTVCALARGAHNRDPRVGVLAAARVEDNTPQLERQCAAAQA